jgi:protein phosphatase
MIIVNGTGVCSAVDEIAFSASLTAYFEGVKHKLYFLSIGSSLTALGPTFYWMNDFFRKKLGFYVTPEQNFQASESVGIADFAVVFDEQLVALKNERMESYFFRGRSMEKLEIGKRLSGGWIMLSSKRLNAEKLQQIGRLTQVGFTPRQVVEQVSKTEPIPASLAIAAISVNVPEKRFLIGNPAFGCLSDRGLTRKNNEDACFTASLSLSTSNKTASYRVLCVADGAGGHGHGEVASREAALEVFAQLGSRIIQRGAESEIQNVLQEAVDSANRRIIEIKSRMISNMATTLTLGLIKDSGLYVGHVGDSRAYIADAETGDIRQLTRDHKYVEDLVEQGVISREEAKTHPQRNIITSALGMDNLRIDILHFRNMFNENSRVIVCSDGLSDLVEDEEISLQAIRRAPPVEIAKSLIRLANERGGLDNISIAIDGYVF